MPRPCTFLALLAFGCLLTAASSALAEEDGAGIEFFERKIRPILVERCDECHSRQSKTLQGGLRLDSRAAIVKGGDTGPAVVPGKPDESLLIQAVGYEGDVQMPPSGKLPADEIALLTEWVRRGAPMPEDGAEAIVKRTINFAEGRKFWSFQPPKRHDPPAVDNAGWVQQPIDAFILAELEKHRLAPSPAADPRTLIRRAYFDLIGLPPTPEEVEEFARDVSADAYSRLVERLLASPHYGERWGRYWLDLARYSDKTASWLSSIAQAWRYRDWVVQALNDDAPYDQFVCRQLATDMLPDADPADLPALGFLGLSPAYWKELKLDKEVIKGIVAEEWEERIDAVGRTFLGLSLACARCHDHKFDPVSTEDYYALAGVLANTRMIDRYLLPDAVAAPVRAAHEKVAAIQEQIKKLATSKPVPPESQSEIDDLKQQIKEIEKATPQYDAPMAHAVDDAALFVLASGAHATKLEYKPGEAIDLHVQIRGNPSKLGPLAPRHFLTVLSPSTPRPFKHGSGRLELAQAIVGAGAPLSARVIVNRVWKHHFGRGIVETVSDFGAQGARPTHPELLDDLTARFVEHGWSLKWLHREIMLSAAYRQASTHDAAKLAADPENRWVWRMSRRRLDVEAWRDAMLAVCGTLDRKVGGPAMNLADQKNCRRTLYGKIDREEPDEMLRLHDFPDASSHSPSREPTTTAIQQLFVLNSPFVEQQAAALAKRIIAEQPGDAAAQIQCAYRLLFGREATNAEMKLGVKYLTTGEPDEATLKERQRQYAQILLGSNEFLFVD